MNQPTRAVRPIKELLEACELLDAQNKELNDKCAEQSRQLADILNKSKDASAYCDLLKTQLGDFSARRERFTERDS